MAEGAVGTNTSSEHSESVLRVYEIGYHVTPSIKEEDLEKVVGSIRSAIEKAGGSFIAEGAPALTKLAYAIGARENDRVVEHDRGYFGWIKFEAGTEAAHSLEESIRQDGNILRFMLFRTLREDTRAKIKAPTLREVKRTDTIKTTTRRTEETAAPVSEEDLEKALQDITSE